MTLKRFLAPILLLTLTIAVGCSTTPNTPSTPIAQAPPTTRSYDVEIIRDTWGVPHIFGSTDADTAYGLGYAHSEDDFQTIQESFIAGRSRLGSIKGPDAAAVDYMVHLLGVWDSVNEKYETDLSPDTRAICEAYADGVNDYAAEHPEKVLIADVFPVTGKDIVAGFVFKSPFFFGLDSAVLELFGPERRHEISTKTADAIDFTVPQSFSLAGEFLRKNLPTGSNTFAVSPSRTADAGTYLAINSHQPYTGPVAWYEAHLHSDEGWDMYGGLFPGMPLIGHGHNRHLGWAHTVNNPDLADVYVLTINPDNPDQYLFDGAWRDFDIHTVTLKVKISDASDMTMNVRREVVRSVHGPVVRADHGVYAIRYAGMGEIRQVEQWYRMNKATSLDEWLDAMRIQGISSLNTGYADENGNILYLYNAKIPLRTPGYDYELYLPGDTSDTLWNDFLPFDDLPRVLNPASGFVLNCNSTPFKATSGDDNPKAEDYPATMGIETHMTNRALRAMELLGADASITWDEFLRYKYDMRYSEDSVMAGAVRKLLAYADRHPAGLDAEALRVLRGWDLSTHPDSRGAALGVMTVFPVVAGGNTDPDAETLVESFTKAAALLKAKHGRVDPPWSEVNRLVRGDVNLGIGGGPDILHAVYGQLDEDTGAYTGRAGDTFILMVHWDADGTLHSQSIHQFGSNTMDAASPHYNDQAKLFVQRKMKPVWMDRAEIEAHAERRYRVGQDRNRYSDGPTATR